MIPLGAAIVATRTIVPAEGATEADVARAVSAALESWGARCAREGAGVVSFDVSSLPRAESPVWGLAGGRVSIERPPSGYRDASRALRLRIEARPGTPAWLVPLALGGTGTAVPMLALGAGAVVAAASAVVAALASTAVARASLVSRLALLVDEAAVAAAAPTSRARHA